MIPDAPPDLAPGFHGVPAGHLAAIVTALEMRAPPTPLGPPEPRPDLWLTRAHAIDLDDYRALFRRVGEPWLWTSRLTWDDAKLRATLHDPGVQVWVLTAATGDATPIGLLELDLRATGACEIAFFGLVGGHTGRGLGGWLMRQALYMAWSHPGVTRVWVHTCTLDSPSALPFYQRLGFVPYARQVEILPDPRLSGVLARAAAPGQPVL